MPQPLGAVVPSALAAPPKTEGLLDDPALPKCLPGSFGIVDVGDAEGEDLPELLVAGANVELASGTLLENVEAAAEEDLLAVVSTDRPIVDGLVPLDVEPDAEAGGAVLDFL